MKVSEIGEFGLIGHITEAIGKAENPPGVSGENLLIGIGDDAAVWSTAIGLELATTDSLVQGTHFDLKTTSWIDLGWKAVAVNLSDIAAMGGIPRYALVSLTLPGDLDVDFVASLYKGMLRIANEFGISIVGGNVTASRIVTIAITIIGDADGKAVLTRTAAVPGDLVAITGYTGLSAAGLRLLKRRRPVEGDAAQVLQQAHLRPMPRISEGQALLHHNVKAAIDISDGLVADLSHVCKASGVDARINENMVPLHPALKAAFKKNAMKLALSGGEDYELLFTAPPQIVEQVKQDLTCPVTVIGEITRGKSCRVHLVDASGDIVSLQQTGWDHFRPQV
jgi:thiamine-monophosphate kinase